MSVESEVLDIVKRVSRRPIEPTLGSELGADLGFDSLQMLELIAELEDHFRIAVPNTVTGIRTVAEVCEQVAALVKPAAG